MIRSLRFQYQWRATVFLPILLLLFRSACIPQLIALAIFDCTVLRILINWNKVKCFKTVAISAWFCLRPYFSYCCCYSQYWKVCVGGSSLLYRRRYERRLCSLFSFYCEYAIWAGEWEEEVDWIGEDECGNCADAVYSTVIVIVFCLVFVNLANTKITRCR